MAAGMKWWAEVRAALRGEARDYTQGPIGEAIVLLAIPMVLEMAMESLFAVVDIFWVARLGAPAVAAVGLTESIESLVYAVAIGLSAGTTAMVARRIGEKDEEGAAHAAAQALLLGLVCSLAIAIPGVVYAKDLLRLMGADAAVLATGAGYAQAMQASTPIILTLFLLNAVFRGAGDAAIAMKVLCVANLINIGLDPVLIYGWGPFPEMGVTGAAVATSIGRGTGVVLQVWALYHARSRVKMHRGLLKPEWKILRPLARVSFTGMVQYIIPTGSWTALVRIIALAGSAALAGYTIAIRIVVFSILPSWGLANAAATLVGQNLGAEKPERAEASVWRCGWYNLIFLGALGLVFLTIPGWLVGLFTGDAEVARYGTRCLRIVATGYLCYGYGMVLSQAFNGAGDTATPTWMNLGCYWALQIPLAWGLAAPGGMGAAGAFWAIPAAETMLALTAVALFRRGKWKEQKI
jgi:putative MATE family efflux protein